MAHTFTNISFPSSRQLYFFENCHKKWILHIFVHLYDHYNWNIVEWHISCVYNLYVIIFPSHNELLLWQPCLNIMNRRSARVR